ncbi:MAG: hypothetical protein RLZZ34_2239, partial [Verrucomicrobiota bacterium]
MKTIPRLLCLLIAGWTLARAAEAPTAPPGASESAPTYEFRPGSFDGTG